MIGNILSAFALLFLLSGCAEPKYVSKDNGPAASRKNETQVLAFPSGLKVFLTWEKFPAGEELGSFLLITGRENLADKSPVPVDPEGEIEVVLWMPSMGHGSTPVMVQKIDVGTYRIGEVFFTMTGDWDIRIRRTLNGVLVEETKLPVRL